MRLIAAASLFALTTSGAQGTVRAFTGATLYDGSDRPPVSAATVNIRDGRIVAVGPAGSVSIPAGAEVVRLDGTFVIPGLINTHGHVNAPSNLENYAAYGITTVMSLGGEPPTVFEARAAQNVPTLNRSRVYLAGPVLDPRDAADARVQVADAARQHVDIVKIRVDDNLGTTRKMTPEVYRAVIDEAHTRGLRVAAHIFYLDDAKDLLRAGVDVIAHSVRDRDVDEDFLALMKTRQAAYVPTLTRELSTFVYESTPAFFSDPFFLKEADPAVVAQLKEPQRQAGFRDSPSAQRYKAALEVAKRSLKRIGDAGILIAMGTDAGPFPERFQGFFEHVEMAMMVEAGLAPAQVLRAATMDAARAMRIEGVGRVAPGAWADLLVLNQDPLRDIRNTRDIASVWIAGNMVAR
jgi:imidazolonepropionase-like amidohydrolase